MEEMSSTGMSTGERLVRIETLMGMMKDALVQHIQDEEKELLETRSLIVEHINATSTVGEDLRAMRRDLHDMQKKMENLEKEVNTLSKNRTWVMAWAAGAGSVITGIVALAGWLIHYFLPG